jgi:hypothetical protein
MVTAAGTTAPTSAGGSRSVSVSTTIANPTTPSEPWTVTTVQMDNEEIEFFLLRHQNRCNAVRKLLSGGK